ncbi:hypothetical protein HPB47_012225, partial [Ixodes persulcatus]
NEGIENRHRTASVGFYIGDPCNLTCSRVLYHVFCNVTSRRCECRPEYPVNIRNRQCVKVYGEIAIVPVQVPTKPRVAQLQMFTERRSLV